MARGFAEPAFALRAEPQESLVAPRINPARKFRVLSLFAGIGAFDLGLERAGFRTVAFCEKEIHARAVLARHWPGVPAYDDIRTLTAERLHADGIYPDAICGGFPCTNISNAAAAHGGHSGLDGDESGLWFEYDRLIGELRPEIVVLENVAAILGRGLGAVLGCLAARGYDAQWDCIRASSVGLPQERDRLWLVAHPGEKRMPRLFTRENFSLSRQGREGRQADMRAIVCAPFERGDRFPQPLLRRVDDRPADRVDRVGECGNAGSPQIMEMIGRAILACDSGRLPEGEAGTAECGASQSGPKGIAQTISPAPKGRGINSEHGGVIVDG